ncbi:MAG: D-alanyl-D-alanine carboxypeptidase/D-alanyl-D-alanine-endopeptidase [Gemmatimonadota bacterium]|nr:D-alanyl-D-alanine carboxypeptidase/D-alanyl-D-alanine-endopeptidase [Gemmatimonadota bacterium]
MKKIHQTLLVIAVAAAIMAIAPDWSPAKSTDPSPESTDAGTLEMASPAMELATAPISGVEISPPSAAPAPVSAAVLDLRSDLEKLIRDATSRGAMHGVLVVSLDRGDTLFAYNADLPLAPASNMKLFTTAAALYYLGPDFRYSTYALAAGQIIDGVLFGDLVLYGTGDPAISSRMLPGALTPLKALADSLRARGITEVRGDIVGDGSYFDDEWIGEGWREEYRLDSYSAPVGALSLAENIISIRVTPGSSTGEPAAISTIPNTHGLLIQNRVTTTASGTSSVRFSWDPEGLIIEGRLARGHPGVARTVTVVDPANFAASAFRTVLETSGIRVGGDVRTVRRPEGSPVSFGAVSSNGGASIPPRVIGTHLSPTLGELVSVANHVSHNLFAESFFKTIGRVALGDGSFHGGMLAVQYFLECEKPFDMSLLHIVDGSGLSPEDRITPRAMVHLLDLMTRTDVWEPFYDSLPEAASPLGGQHSLRGRMGGTPAARNLRAKTGTINNVSGLSGYVRAADGERLAFSILTNEIPATSRAKRMEDAIGIRLANFTRPAETGPGSSSVAPASTTPATAAPVNAAPAATAPSGQVSSGSGGSAPAAGTTGRTSATATAPSTPAPAAAATAPATASRTHKVRAGQTMDGIARQYGTTVAELRRVNPGIEPRRIQVGQTIRLP